MDNEMILTDQLLVITIGIGKCLVCSVGNVKEPYLSMARAPNSTSNPLQLPANLRTFTQNRNIVDCDVM